MNIETIRSLVRPFITVSFVLMTVFCVLKGMISGQEVLTIMGIVMAFYFGERSTKKGEENEKV